MKISRKGVTLIELILVIAIVLLIGTIPVNMYILGQKSHASTAREFDLQSNLRLASQNLTNTIRTSSATFLFSDQIENPDLANPHYINAFKDDNIFGTDKSIVLDDSFLLGNTFLKKAVERYAGWSFLVLNESKTELREFKWSITGVKATDGHYTMTKIIEEQLNPKMVYDITFRKISNFYEDAQLEFMISGKIEGSVSNSIEIKSQLEALNSLQIIDRGKEEATISNALFYRKDDRPVPTDAEAVVAMVLDKSGSMSENMGGKTRMKILKEQASGMIDKFGESGLGKTNINVIPFSTSANSTSHTGFVDVTDETLALGLKSVINNLVAVGGTNVGDGMRQAYYQIMKTNTDTVNQNKNKYIMVLMDGNPTYGSVHSSDGYFYSETNQGTQFTDEYGRIFNYHSYQKSGTYNKYYYFYRQKNNDPVYVLNDTDINESDRGGYFRFIGGTYGSGTETNANRVIGKEYIDQVSALLKNIKDSKGKTNVKIFIIGFSDKTADLTELKNIETLIKNNGISTKRWEAKSDGDLNSVFTEIRNIIMDETWHIDGPDWSLPVVEGD